MDMQKAPSAENGSGGAGEEDAFIKVLFFNIKRNGIKKYGMFTSP